jgi:hypothetical protein
MEQLQQWLVPKDMLHKREAMGDKDVIRSGDLAAAVVRSGDSVCLAVVEISDFRVPSQKLARTCISNADVDNDTSDSILATIRVLDLRQIEPESSKSPVPEWEWTQRFVCTN